MRIKVTIGMLLIGCVMLIAPARATSGAKPRSEVYSALAQLPSGGSTTNVKIYINGYSTSQDDERLHETLLKGGSNALLKALGKMKTLGKIEREGSVAFYNFKLIVSTNTPTGRHIY